MGKGKQYVRVKTGEEYSDEFQDRYNIKRKGTERQKKQEDIIKKKLGFKKKKGRRIRKVKQMGKEGGEGGGTKDEKGKKKP